MKMPPVAVEAMSIGQLLSGEYRFVLPWFQRAYAWPKEQVIGLVEDIVEAMSRPPAERHYPLGTLVLARPEGSLETSIVDGHQRLMTLTILFAVLRDLEVDMALKARLASFIASPDALGRFTAYRLTGLGEAAEFLSRMVQVPGATTADERQGEEAHDEASEALDDLSASEQHIVENRDTLLEKVRESCPDDAARRALANFLIERCWVIVHLADDEDEAWRRLRIDEDTRLAFVPEDRARSSLLSLVPRSRRRASSATWTRCERLIGAAAMFDLLGALRLQKVRKVPARRPIEVDLAEAYDLRGNGAGFVDAALWPAAQRVDALYRGDIGNAAAGSAITRLTWIDRPTWLPAALTWLAVKGAGHAETARFFTRLERLVWATRVGGTDAVVRDRRFIRIMSHIERGRPLVECRELDIEQQLRGKLMEQLRSPRLGSKGYAGALLRRVSVVLGDDPGPIDREHVTIEHLLPRNPEAKSQWLKTFKGRKLKDNVNRLGNLTLMTSAHNGEADRQEWPAKRAILERSAFALSSGLAAEEDWNPGTVHARSERLIAALLADWELA